MDKVYVIYAYGGDYEDHWHSSCFVVRDEKTAIEKVKELNYEAQSKRQTLAAMSEKCSNCPLNEYTDNAEYFKMNNPESTEDELTEDKCKNAVGDYCSEFQYINASCDVRCKFHFDRVWMNDNDTCGYNYESAELLD